MSSTFTGDVNKRKRRKIFIIKFMNHSLEKNLFTDIQGISRNEYYY